MRPEPPAFFMPALNSVAVDAHPTTRGGRSLHCMQDSLHGKRVFKVRMKGFLPGYGTKKISQRSDERMLVSQNVAGLPEVFSVGLVQPGDGNAAPALQIGWLRSIEKIKLVHLIESKSQHSLRAIHFKRIAILASHTITSCLEGADAAVSKAHHQ